ncbi:MAG: HNH endonuclease [Chloroflexota bacterium]|nr:HNH endonuclease [Chloroflexota bacterium]
MRWQPPIRAATYRPPLGDAVMPRKGEWGQWHQAKRARAFIARHPYCAACGATERLTVDHGRARIYGDVNPNDESWWQVLCRSCNARKGTSDLTLDQLRELAEQAKARREKATTPVGVGGTIAFIPRKPRIG